MSEAVRVFLYQYGDAALLDNYVKALTAAGMEGVVSADINDCASCAGLLLPGGYDSDPSLYGQPNIASRNVDWNRDLAELALVRRFAAAKKPILGVCRGHQLLNFAFGGDLIQDIATKENHVEIDDVDQLHPTAIAADSFLAPLYGAGAVVTSAHHQAVGRLGEGFRAVQWTADGVVEAMEHSLLPILGVQWHPERQAFARKRDGAADGARLFVYFKSLCQ